MQVTIPLEGREPFTAVPDEDRWVEIPVGTKPAGAAFSECEADVRDLNGNIPYRHKDIFQCECWSTWEFMDRQYRIRPTRGRSWSDIGLEAQDPVWTVVHSPVPLDQVEEVQVRVSGDDWRRAAVVDGHSKWEEVLLAAGRYRVRLRQSEPQGQKTFLRVDKGGPFDTQPQGESESDFMRRMLGLCVFAVTVKASDSIIVLKPFPLLPPADALRLARIIAEAKA